MISGGNHGDHTAENTANGNGADLTGRRQVAILPKSHQATPKEPGADGGGKVATEEELNDSPKGFSPTARRGGGGGRTGGRREGGARRRHSGREVTEHPAEVLIPPPSMIGSGVARKAARDNLLKGSPGEGRRMS